MFEIYNFVEKNKKKSTILISYFNDVDVDDDEYYDGILNICCNCLFRGVKYE